MEHFLVYGSRPTRTCKVAHSTLIDDTLALALSLIKACNLQTEDHSIALQWLRAIGLLSVENLSLGVLLIASLPPVHNQVNI